MKTRCGVPECMHSSSSSTLTRVCLSLHYKKGYLKARSILKFKLRSSLPHSCCLFFEVKVRTWAGVSCTCMSGVGFGHWNTFFSANTKICASPRWLHCFCWHLFFLISVLDFFVMPKFSLHCPFLFIWVWRDERTLEKALIIFFPIFIFHPVHY